jgi:hypothetical protein
MSKRVVFTGPATDKQGRPIVRKDLIQAASEAGLEVSNKIDAGVELLVASRTDTVKAKSAAASGIAVVDYAAFVSMLEALGVEIKHSGAAPDKYVDAETKPSHWVNASGKPGGLL